MGALAEYSALNWVKKELDETLSRATHALQDFVEGSGDPGVLEGCVQDLHQAHGTLEMVEVYGAALLAEEMELACGDLAKAEIKHKEEACDVLARSIIQLQDYLEKVQGGQKDIPILLLPLLNDLRATRGAPLLSEAALFSPDLSNFGEDVATTFTSAQVDVGLVPLARQLRHLYQLGLLRLLRDRNARRALEQIRGVLTELEGRSTLKPVKQLWSISCALTDALLEGGMQAGVSVKLLFGQIDRQIKRLIDEGELEFGQRPALGLIKNLLYYVASAEPVSKALERVKHDYGLHAALPTERELELARERLSAPNAALIRSVVTAVKEDLASVKDGLDLHVRAGAQTGQVLEPLVESLRRVGDTLGMLGRGDLRHKVLEQVDRLRQLTATEGPPSEADFMDLASAILVVESSLGIRGATGYSRWSDSDAESARDPAQDHGTASDQAPAEVYREVHEAALREVMTDMARAKDAIVTFINTPEDRDLLGSVPALLTNVRGALQVLSMERAAAVMAVVVAVIREEMLASSRPPAQEKLDTLADAITSVEYFIEAVSERLPNQDSILDVAEESVERLGHGTRSSIPKGDPDSREQLEQGDVAERPELDGISLPSAFDEPSAGNSGTEAHGEADATDAWWERSPEAVEMIEIATPAEEHAENPGEEAPAREPACLAGDGRESNEPISAAPALGLTVEELEETRGENETEVLQGPGAEAVGMEQPEAESSGGPSAHATESMSGDAEAVELQPDSVDEEIVDIFLEEARDVIRQIGENLSRWELDPEDGQALTDLRRAFHTLKGSGRMAGAQTIGELGWAIEDVLNRILDESIVPMPALFELLRETADVLPTLVGCLEQRMPYPGETQALVARAHAIAEAGGPPDGADAGRSSESPIEPAESGAKSPAEAGETESSGEEVGFGFESTGDGAKGSGPECLEETSETLDIARAMVEGEPSDESLEPPARAPGESSSQPPAESTREEPLDAVAAQPAVDAGRHAAENECSVPYLLKDEGEAIAHHQLSGQALQEAAECREGMDQANFESSRGAIAQSPDEVSKQGEKAGDGMDGPSSQPAASELNASIAEETAPPERGALPPDDMVGIAETAREVSEPGGELAAPDAPEDGPKQTPHVESQGPPQMDATLYEIFSSEARAHLQVLEDFVARARGSELPCAIAEGLTRAVHTLHGSAQMAGASVIAEVSGYLERALRRLAEQGAGLDEEGVQVLSEAREAIDSLLLCVNRPEAAPPDDRALLGRIERLSERSMHRPTAIVDPRSSSAAVVEGNVLGGAPPAGAKTQVAPAGADAERDEELLGVFLEEARDLLDTMDDAIQKWEQRLNSPDTLTQLQRLLHTLKGGARLVGVPSMAELSHALESMLTPMLGGSLAAREDHVEVMQRALDRLSAMLEDVSRGSGTYPANELVEEILDLVEGEEDPPLAPGAERGGKPEVARSAREALGEESPAREEAPGMAVPGERAGLLAQPRPDPAQATDRYDAEMLDIFREEARDLLEGLQHSLERWQNAPGEGALLSELQRSLHTLKGGARLVGIVPMGDLSHSLESMFVALSKGEVSPGHEHLRLAQCAVDRLSDMLERVTGDEPIAAQNELIAEIAASCRGSGERRESRRNEGVEPAQSRQPVAQASVPLRTEPGSDFAESLGRTEEPTAKQVRTAPDQVRVRADLLDSLVNYSGEVSIYRARLDQQTATFRFNLAELEQTVVRLREQLRKMSIEAEAQILYRYERESDSRQTDFDPLELDRFSLMQELSRSLMESVNDISNLQGLLAELNRESETLLLQQSRVTNDLHEGLMRTRMVPFSNLVPRMRRLVRQTSQQLGKSVELEVLGGEGEMDRTILDRMLAPLEHLLRNAISHGIESPEVRRQAGKPEEGRITLALSREGTDVVIEVADDGCGIDTARVREKANLLGLIRDDNSLTEDDLLQFILESGVSTAKEVTQIAGRGVGMDVVNSEIKQLGGSLQIDSQRGGGTSFTIRLPFTLAINQAILVQVGEETYAVPLSSVEGVVRASREELHECYESPDRGFDYAGRSYQVRHLGTILGTAESRLEESMRWAPMLLVRTGEHRVALQLEGLSGSREIVIKPVGPQLSTVRWISGATILADGRVVLILDVASIARMRPLRAGHPGLAAEPAAIVPSPTEERQLLVMVVDDSITVRKVTGRLLERNHMAVVTAKDGVEALALLEEAIPDVMLLDIEMPRMDGFELARHLRGTDRLSGVPIIMITSRTGDKHRKRAKDLGVDDYLGKPFQESELLEHIHALVESRSVS